MDGRRLRHPGLALPGGGRKRAAGAPDHGGPHTLYGFSPMWEWQVIAGAGSPSWAQIRAGRRATAASSTAATWLTGVTARRATSSRASRAIADGLADPERLGVTGGSYGGYLTNSILGHDQRFAAGITCRSVADMSMLFLTGDIAGGNGPRSSSGDALVRSRAVPGDVAGELRPGDPDPPAHPARGAGSAHDGRAGRGAVHRPAVTSPAGAVHARPGREPRADPFGDAPSGAWRTSSRSASGSRTSRRRARRRMPPLPKAPRAGPA